MRYPKLQAAVDEMLARAVQTYGEQALTVMADILLAPEPPEPTAKPAEQSEKKAGEGNPQ